jgi:FdhD protein
MRITEQAPPPAADSQPRAAVAAPVVEWRDGECRPLEDHVAGEEPLEIRVNGVPVSVTMRTPGHDEELAAGFLYTEGLIKGPAELAHVRPASRSSRCNVIEALLAAGAPFDPSGLQRHFFASSSCGICGKATIAAIRRQLLPPAGGAMRLTADVLCGMPGALHAAQEVFARTGGLHAAALFNEEGTLLAVREDVGRHNAVDKLVGWALVEGRLPLAGSVLLVSGRGGFEIVQKAVAAGVPIVACISAPSSLAVQLAREMHVTLVGFLRGRRFLVYSGNDRIVAAADSTDEDLAGRSER